MLAFFVLKCQIRFVRFGKPCKLDRMQDLSTLPKDQLLDFIKQQEVVLFEKDKKLQTQDDKLQTQSDQLTTQDDIIKQLEQKNQD